jgi:murein DD-endopeptidase MepM/ murein hydrolase activator NlpD
MSEKNIIFSIYTFIFLIFMQFLGLIDGGKLLNEKMHENEVTANLQEKNQLYNEIDELFNSIKYEKEEKQVTNNYDLMEFYDQLESGETFSNMLSKYNISDSISQSLIKKMSGHVDFKKCRPGDKFKIAMGYDGKLESLVFERGEFEQYVVVADKDNYDFKVVQEAVTIQREVVKVSGTVEDSLFEAFSKVGLGDQLTLAFADIFASKIDFNREVKTGDTFDLVFERYKKGEEIIGYGRILAAKYKGLHGEQDAFFYEDMDKNSSGTYYDAKGESKMTAFLKSPLPLFKVTSKFTNSRLHPVLGYNRPHHGIDLAAPVGTPVRAVSDGEVIFAGTQSGYGNILILKHENNYETYYAHLSKFASNIKKGARVSQKDVVAYVGMTGITTGPHLDYRIKYNGNFVDPEKITGESRRVIVAKSKAKFSEDKEFLVNAIKNPNNFVVLKVEIKHFKSKPAGWLG